MNYLGKPIGPIFGGQAVMHGHWWWNG